MGLLTRGKAVRVEVAAGRTGEREVQRELF